MRSSKKFNWHPSEPWAEDQLLDIYKRLRAYFGHRGWWPGRTRFEIIIGAILTQNTAWTNVEKAIVNLRKNRVLDPKRMSCLSQAELAELIRPSGYFNIKAKRIKNFLHYLETRYQFNFKIMFAQSLVPLRRELLGVNGIGPETADSILLYAGGRETFVIDAYTKRVFSRHLLGYRKNAGAKSLWKRQLEVSRYETWKTLFEDNLPMKRDLFNDFHAQIVALAKEFCKKARPACEKCPLNRMI